MSSKESKKSFPDQKQRTAFCYSQWQSKSHILNVVADHADKMNKYVFESKQEAVKMAKKIGLEGAHSHKTGDGKTLWMPGKNMKDFKDWYKNHSA